MGRRFADLKARFQAGQLDAASYEAALHELMVEHEGTFWTLGAEMEVWYCHNGTQWVQDTPPTLAAGEQPTLVDVFRAESPLAKKSDGPPVGLGASGSNAEHKRCESICRESLARPGRHGAL